MYVMHPHMCAVFLLLPHVYHNTRTCNAETVARGAKQYGTADIKHNTSGGNLKHLKGEATVNASPETELDVAEIVLSTEDKIQGEGASCHDMTKPEAWHDKGKRKDKTRPARVSMPPSSKSLSPSVSGSGTPMFSG